MTLTMRYFGAASEAAGVDSESVNLPDGALVADLLAALTASHPQLERLLPVCAILIDGARPRGDDEALPAVATVDILPPFAGG